VLRAATPDDLREDVKSPVETLVFNDLTKLEYKVVGLLVYPAYTPVKGSAVAVTTLTFIACKALSPMVNDSSRSLLATC